VLAVVGLAVVLADDPYVAPAPSGEVTDADPAAATLLLGDLAGALADGDAAAARDLAPAGDDASAALLGSLAENARALRVDGLSLRYVDSAGVPAADGSWTVRADLTWAVRGFDPGPARIEVEVRLRRVDGALGVTGFGGSRLPLWLQGPVEVDRTASTLVVGAVGSLSPYVGLVRRALPQVRRVLPGTTGRLVVEVPGSSTALDALLGVPEGTYRGVAAVTASVDGAVATDAPVHVFVNPEEMDRLRRTGAQVVMTHEAVHAVTGAPSSRAPVWLVEGFADYVALLDVDLPLSRTAAQVIDRVRRDGLPRELPATSDFDVAAPHLGAAYEAAWLACRALVDLAGQQALVDVYREASASGDVDADLERAGTSVAEVTARWRELLRAAAAGSAA
jgi:hypothetical protein